MTASDTSRPHSLDPRGRLLHHG